MSTEEEKARIQEEIRSLRAEQQRLTPLVEAYGKQLDEMEYAKRQVGLTFTTLWVQRNKVERRLLELEKRVKYLKPSGEERKAKKLEVAIETLITGLSPEKLALLMALVKPNKEE